MLSLVFAFVVKTYVKYGYENKNKTDSVRKTKSVCSLNFYYLHQVGSFCTVRTNWGSSL